MGEQRYLEQKCRQFFVNNTYLCQHLWKIVRAIFQCIVVCQLQGEGPKKIEEEKLWNGSFHTF